MHVTFLFYPRHVIICAQHGVILIKTIMAYTGTPDMHVMLTQH